MRNPLHMLESRDILFIVLAFCALWFTAFLCWLMYQAAVLMKRLHGLVDEMKVKVADLEDAVHSMRRKFDGNIAMVAGIADGIRNVIEVLRDRKRRSDEE